MSLRRISPPATARTATTAALTEPNLRRPSGDPARGFSLLEGSFWLLRLVRDWSRSLKSGFESRPLRSLSRGRQVVSTNPRALLEVSRRSPDAASAPRDPNWATGLRVI